MVKRIFLIFFSVFLIFCGVFSPINAAAYEITGFKVTAKAAMLVSMDTGETLYSKNARKKIYPAAITNIMTAVVIMESEKYNPKAKITMTEKALTDILGTGVAVSNTVAGEEFTQTDLLHLLLMCSCGDVGYLAADYFYGGHEGFVAKMNETAKKIGLKNTNYTNPIGLHDSKHYTTAEDIYVLTEYALKIKGFEEICEKARYQMQATNKREARTLSTTNFLLPGSQTNYEYSYAKGVKTGYTDEAGRCVVSIASYNGYNYMCIVMGCENSAQKRYEFAESAELYRWAFNEFVFKEVANSADPVCEIPVELSMETDFIPLYFEESFVSVLPKDADESTIVIKEYLYSESVQAPVKKGTVLGEAEVIFAEKVLGRVKLVTKEDVKSNNLLKTMETVKGFFGSFYMKAVYAVIAIVVLIFIIMCIRMNIKHTKKRRVKYVPYRGKERENKNR